MDNELTQVPPEEIIQQAMVNLWKDGGEGGYLVRRGRNPLSDFPSADDDAGANIWEKAFPVLFPYGEGGLEKKRLVNVTLSEHVRWALEYHDRRFQVHPTFSFMAFGILQRRQALMCARIRMRRRDFERDAQILSAITADELKHAAEEEDRGEQVTSDRVRLLKRLVYSSSARVMGSDSSRKKLRSEIRATTTHFGPPSLWITINPDDLHDPIAQIFAGEEIDLDAFCRTVGPDKRTRACNIARNGYAGAKFFRFIIQVTLETLFGIKVSGSRVLQDKGVFGYVSAYFGTVESQGRGTLHLHLLVWLKNTPTSTQMKDLLKKEEFREKVSFVIK